MDTNGTEDVDEMESVALLIDSEEGKKQMEAQMLR
jgi:hypothetical protein